MSNSVIKYGTQFLRRPVPATGPGRLLPETACGSLMIRSEIEGVELSAVHLTALSSKFKSGEDSKSLKQVDAEGGSYQSLITSAIRFASPTSKKTSRRSTLTSS